jgi:hypothetical protein
MSYAEEILLHTHNTHARTHKSMARVINVYRISASLRSGRKHTQRSCDVPEWFVVPDTSKPGIFSLNPIYV